MKTLRVVQHYRFCLGNGLQSLEAGALPPFRRHEVSQGLVRSLDALGGLMGEW